MRAFRFHWFCLLAMLCSSCGREELRPPAAAAPEEKTAADYASDNTGRNVRDRRDETLTPVDQSSSETDLQITREIRQAIADDRSLSVNAKNVKIITIGGTVTLRGPVESEDEKTSIEQTAAATVDVKHVDNQLEIKH